MNRYITNYNYDYCRPRYPLPAYLEFSEALKNCKERLDRINYDIKNCMDDNKKKITNNLDNDKCCNIEKMPIEKNVTCLCCNAENCINEIHYKDRPHERNFIETYLHLPFLRESLEHPSDYQQRSRSEYQSTISKTGAKILRTNKLLHRAVSKKKKKNV